MRAGGCGEEERLVDGEEVVDPLLMGVLYIIWGGGGGGNDEGELWNL